VNEESALMKWATRTGYRWAQWVRQRRSDARCRHILHMAPCGSSATELSQIERNIYGDNLAFPRTANAPPSEDAEPAGGKE